PSVLKRQATSSLLKLPALIWSRGEYRVNRRSAPLVGHSPFLVEGWPWPENCCGIGVPTKIWPRTCGAAHIRLAAASPSTDAETSSFRDIVHSRFARNTITWGDFLKEEGASLGQKRARSNGG